MITDFLLSGEQWVADVGDGLVGPAGSDLLDLGSLHLELDRTADRPLLAVLLDAAQGGVVLGRLYVERIARNGVLLAGLSTTAVVTVVLGWTPPVLVAGTVTGAAAYAATEAARTLVYARERGVADRATGVDEAFARRAANAIAVIDKDIEAELHDIDAA